MRMKIIQTDRRRDREGGHREGGTNREIDKKMESHLHIRLILHENSNGVSLRGNLIK